MAHRDSLYQFSGVIEVDDALVGGKRSGKRGRSAAGKDPVLIACERKRVFDGQKIYSDALPAPNVIHDTHDYEARVTLPGKVDELLLWVHIADVFVGYFSRCIREIYARTSQ